MMALPDDQEAWLASLTVAKLKDELKARNINVPSTKKLKAELQELLRQALLEEPSNVSLVWFWPASGWLQFRITVSVQNNLGRCKSIIPCCASAVHHKTILHPSAGKTTISARSRPC